MDTKEKNNSNPDEAQLSGFAKFMQSHTARLIMVGLITIILIIPLSQIGWLIKERQDRQESVKEELKTEWGGELYYHGIILEVPYIQPGTKKQQSLFIYPETSEDAIKSSVTERYRGIFKANLFSAEISSASKFDLSKIVTDPKYVTADWNKAKFILVTGRNVEFKELKAFRINGKEIGINEQLESVMRISGTHNNYTNIICSYSNPFKIDPAGQNQIQVSTNVLINSSCSLNYQSLASKSKMELSSNWKSPSFSGSLPDNNSFQLSKNGFTAKWNKMSQLGSGSRHSDNEIVDSSQASSGITFMTMVDQYQLNERTIKYGLLVLVLTFAVFFLIQLIGKVNVHPVHYLMIGLALLLFYSLLLAFSEHLGFNKAYCIAALAIILLIVWYAKAILNSLKFAIVSGVSLTLLYGFLLVIVNLEIYAMLVGSLGLLVVLAAIMSVTRKLNFNKL